MKGKVEVLAILDDGREKLLYEDSNLIVNLAGQTIVDMLTTPSATFGIEPRLMDTSNWVVQAMSFGKDSSAYYGNAHQMPSRRNLLQYSTPSDSSLNGVSGDSTLLISSTPTLSPPSPYQNVPSSTAHVVTVGDTDIAANQGLSCSLTVGNPGCLLSTSAGQDNWYCFSVYLKSPVPEHSFWYHPYASPIKLGPQIKIQIEGEGYVDSGNTDGGLGKSRTFTDVDLAFPNFTTPSSLNIGYTTDKRYTTEGAASFMGVAQPAASAGYSINEWDANNGVIDAGDDWYRVYGSVLAPVSATSSIQCTVYPARWSDSVGLTSGAVYTYGWQLENGRWPTDLQFNNAFSATNWDMSGSVLNREASIPGYNVSGIVRVSGTAGVSSYTSTNRLDKYPDPLDYHLVTTNQQGQLVSTEGEFGTSSIVSGFNMGHNLNLIPYRQQNLAYQTNPVFFNCFPNQVEQGTQQKSLLEIGMGVGNIPSGLGSIGPQAYFEGCYPDGSSMGGTDWAIVTSLDSSAAYGFSGEYSIASGNYDSGFNEASTMDVSGFIGKVWDPINGRVGEQPAAADASISAFGLEISSVALATATFADNGKVSYQTTIFSGDCGMANMYGGIYNIGLWTLDAMETVKNTTASFPFNPLNNPRKYRLFSSKKFINNLTAIHDNGVWAGATNYSSLKIIWTLDFRATGE